MKKFMLSMNENHDYIVSVADYNGIFPLRCFGQRQSDAIDFKMFDCPKLSDLDIKLLIKNYSDSKIYKRISGSLFKICNDNY